MASWEFSCRHGTWARRLPYFPPGPRPLIGSLGAWIRASDSSPRRPMAASPSSISEFRRADFSMPGSGAHFGPAPPWAAGSGPSSSCPPSKGSIWAAVPGKPSGPISATPANPSAVTLRPGSQTYRSVVSRRQALSLHARHGRQGCGVGKMDKPEARTASGLLRGPATLHQIPLAFAGVAQFRPISPVALSPMLSHLNRHPRRVLGTIPIAYLPLPSTFGRLRGQVTCLWASALRETVGNQYFPSTLLGYRTPQPARRGDRIWRDLKLGALPIRAPSAR